jgi:flagellar hook-length control protein FliK
MPPHAGRGLALRAGLLDAGSASSSGSPTGGSSASGGGSFGPGRGAQPFTGLPGGRSARAGAHDTLWVPDPGQTSPLEGSVSASGQVAALAEAAGAARDSAALAGGQAPGADLGPLDLGAGLQQAIETLHGTIELAARQGLSQARIALQPEELGAIRIHLTQTADGLLARVTAETPAAAQALAAGHAELRQSLSALGINLARLHIGAHEQIAAQGDGAAAGGRGQGQAGARGQASRDAAASTRPTAVDIRSNPIPDPVADELDPLAPTPSGRALVDVLV